MKPKKFICVIFCKSEKRFGKIVSFNPYFCKRRRGCHKIKDRVMMQEEFEENFKRISYIYSRKVLD